MNHRSSGSCFALASIASLLVTFAGHAAAAPNREALCITVNGADRAADAPYYAIFPGRANKLAIRPDWDALGKKAWMATLVRTLPDGRSDQTTAELVPGHSDLIFDLGAFAAPAEYDFEHGVVYRRGYRFKLTVADTSTAKDAVVFDFYQGPAREAESEALWIGDVVRHVYNSDQTGAKWAMTRRDQGRQMDPPFILALDWAVLLDPFDVRVQFGQRVGLHEEPVPAKLIVTQLSDGKKLLERDVNIGPNPATERVDTTSFPEGDYRIELQPIVAGTTHREGPRLTYHRSPYDGTSAIVSPLAPWTFQRDSNRKQVTISDFQDAVPSQEPDFNAAKWTFGKRLAGAGDVWTAPVIVRPGLKGHYAVYAQTAGVCYLKVGKDPIVRRIGSLMSFDHAKAFSQTPPGSVSMKGEQFVVATDMTDGDLAIYQSGAKGSGIVSVRFVPVTAASVSVFEKETSQPPLPLAGVCDWLDYFLPGSEPRLAADQFETLVKTHAELGIRDLHWAVGRSVLLYESKLPNSTRFPAVPLNKCDPKSLKAAPHFRTWDYVVNQYCPLTEVERYRARYGVRLQPWLAMQRHYGGGYGGVFMSRWFASHSEWHEWRKQASRPVGSTICYYFPEVRKERVNILCELAERQPDGLLVDGVRQPPMLGYHPKMVAAYKAETGIDAQSLDASAGKAYEDWLRWRAEFFTKTLRELKTRLKPIRERTGQEIPVIIRIPSAGLFYSMAQGFDVETWCREALVERIELEPLEDFGGRGSHDVRPYVQLGHRHHIPVVGGINLNSPQGCTALMKRALGLLEARVDGLYFYESSNLSGTDHLRWIIPLLGNPKRLGDFLKTSNLEACDPVRATNCCSGFDNHSRFDDGASYDVFGRKGKIAL